MGHQLSIIPEVQPQQTQGVPPAGVQPSAVAPQGNEQSLPPSPEELEQRKVGWRGFFQRLKTDKALKAMLFTMGTQLMQPLQARQSSIGQLGTALQSGNEARLKVEAGAAAGAASSRELDIKQQAADASTKKASGGKAPAAEVQVLQFLAAAKVKEAATQGKQITIESALLEAEKDRRSKDPLDYFSSVLPLLALMPDPKERALMTQRVMESIALFGKSGNLTPSGEVKPSSKDKTRVWSEEQQKFVWK